jgi:hypothetical protein
MNNNKTSKGSVRHALAGAALLLAPAACGGAVSSGVAVGRIGDGLSARAQGVPQGAQVCAMQDALAAPTAGGTEKPSGEVCAKALKSDLLWRRALVAMGAYGETLETLSSGQGATAGPLEAALTGVRGPDWIEVEGSEKAARDAVTKLVGLLADTSSKGDLGRLVSDAAPPIKTLCEGLLAYLDGQSRALSDMQREVDKKRAQRTDRRCAQLEGRSVCVSESVLDRMVYGDAFARLSLLESNHIEAHDSVASFCAAHKKLEEAAADGRLSKDKTYADIVDAVKAVPRGTPSGAGKPAAPAKK